MSRIFKKFTSLFLALAVAFSMLTAFSAVSSAGTVIKCKVNYKDDKAIVTLTPQSSANRIYYTVNGSKPSLSSKRYSKQITLSKKTRIRAVEYDRSNKQVASLDSVVKPRVQSPVIRITKNPDGTRYISASTLTKKAVIRYTTDGTEPTSSSPKLKGSVLYTEGTTITVSAFRSGFLPSSSVSYNSGGSAAISSSETTEESIAGVFKLINKERSAVGKPSLVLDEKLCEAAAIRAKELVDLFDHMRPDGSDCFTVLDDLGIRYGTVGENIAEGQRTAEKVMQSWMNSPGHRSNILSEDFGKVGIGCYEKDGEKYWVQLFTD